MAPGLPTLVNVTDTIVSVPVLLRMVATVCNGVTPPARPCSAIGNTSASETVPSSTASKVTSASGAIAGLEKTHTPPLGTNVFRGAPLALVVVASAAIQRTCGVPPVEVAVTVSVTAVDVLLVNAMLTLENTDTVVPLPGSYSQVSQSMSACSLPPMSSVRKWYNCSGPPTTGARGSNVKSSRAAGTP